MFSTCSELTPRAPIPDGRMERIMQPCHTYPCLQQSLRIERYKRKFENLDLIEMLLVTWRGFVGDEGCDERLFASTIFSFLLDLSECETVYSSLLSDLRIA